MFQFCTDDVVDQLLKAVRSVADILPYIKGTVGDLSDAVINELFRADLLLRSSPSNQAQTPLLTEGC